MNTLETAIRNLEGQLTVARDKAKHHRDRAEYYDRQVVTLDAAVNAIVAVMGGRVDLTKEPVEALILDESQTAYVEGSVAYEAQEAPAEAAKPFPRNNGSKRNPSVLDRNLLRRELRARNIHYPVAKSYRYESHFVRQSVITACVTHPDYAAFLNAGGEDLHANHRKENIEFVVGTLGINIQKVIDDASVLHRLIYTAGVEGTDYL